MSDRIQQCLAKARASREAGDTAQARRTLETALARCRAGSENEHGDRASVLKALGQIERDAGRPDAAIERYQEAVLECRRGSVGDRLAHTVRHLADVYQDLGRLAEAEPLYVGAIGLYGNAPASAPLDLANAMRPLAMLRQRLGRDGEARRLWLEAKLLYERAGVTPGVEECDRRLRELDE